MFNSLTKITRQCKVILQELSISDCLTLNNKNHLLLIITLLYSFTNLISQSRFGEGLEKLHHYIIFKPSNWLISSSYVHDSDSFREWSVVDQSVCLLLYFTQSVNSLILKVFSCISRESFIQSYHGVTSLSSNRISKYLFWIWAIYDILQTLIPTDIALSRLFAWWLHYYDIIPSPIWWIHNTNLRLGIFMTIPCQYV